MGYNSNDISYIDANGNRITVGVNTPLPTSGGGGGGGGGSLTQPTAANPFYDALVYMGAVVSDSNLLGVKLTQALPTGDNTLGRVKITDNSGNPTVIKGTGVAAQVSDPSFVVALSPNSPLPTGTNFIGQVNVSQGGTTAAVKGSGVSSVTTDNALVVQLSPNTPLGQNALPIYNKGASAIFTDTLAAAVNAVSTTLAAADAKDFQSVTVQVNALSAFTGTIVWEVSNDNVNWRAKNLVNSDNGFIQNTIPVSGITGSFLLAAGDIGARYFRVRISAYTSGQIQVFAVLDALSTASIPSQTTTLNSSTNVIGRVGIHDGVNGVSIKGATTAANTGDPSLTVALSPNSPVPNGTNNIGNTGATSNAESGSAGALNAVVGGAIDLSNMSQVAFQVNGAYTGTLTLEVSVDGFNWQTKTLIAPDLNRVSTITSSPLTTAFGHIGARYFRARMSAYTSGTATITIRYNSSTGEMPIASVSLGGAKGTGDSTSGANIDMQSFAAFNNSTWDRIRNALGAQAGTVNDYAVHVATGAATVTSLSAAAAPTAGTALDNRVARPGHTMQVDVTTTTVGTTTHSIILEGSLDGTYYTTLGTVTPAATSTTATDPSNHANVSVQGFPYRFVRARWASISTGWVGTLTARVVSA